MGRYELNPLGSPEVEYVAKREALLAKLTPAEAAIFMFLENLWNLEQEKLPSGETRHLIRWGGQEVSTGEMLRDAVDLGSLHPLPIPDTGEHQAFLWRSLEPKGGAEVRILNGRYHLTIYPNLGQFDFIADRFPELVGEIPYPINVQNANSRPLYQNPAMIDRARIQE